MARNRATAPGLSHARLLTTRAAGLGWTVQRAARYLRIMADQRYRATGTPRSVKSTARVLGLSEKEVNVVVALASAAVGAAIGHAVAASLDESAKRPTRKATKSKTTHAGSTRSRVARARAA